MRRRELIKFLGSTAAWPLAARAQQSERMRRVGVLSGLGENDPEWVARRKAFEGTLETLGWKVGSKITIDYRATPIEADRTRNLAAEIVAVGPDVILTSGNIVVAPMIQATSTIPIVFVQVIDPVGSGYVERMAQPGGNVTGFTQFEYSLAGKWLELLKEIAPGVSRVAVLRDATRGPGIGQFAVIQSIAPQHGVEVTPINALLQPAEIERAITTLGKSPNAGLIVAVGSAAFHRDLVIAAAARNRLPAIYPYRYFAAGGGLISYGPDTIDQYRSAARYVDRILKGEKPGDLPVQAPTKYELVINLKTAKILGLTMPSTVMARADEIID
jgi:putative ABC transport system substrate-binding protein